MSSLWGIPCDFQTIVVWLLRRCKSSVYMLMYLYLPLIGLMCSTRKFIKRHRMCRYECVWICLYFISRVGRHLWGWTNAWDYVYLNVTYINVCVFVFAEKTINFSSFFFIRFTRRHGFYERKFNSTVWLLPTLLWVEAVAATLESTYIIRTPCRRDWIFFSSIFYVNLFKLFPFDLKFYFCW